MLLWMCQDEQNIHLLLELSDEQNIILSSVF